VAAEDFNQGFALTIGTPFNFSVTANDAQAMFDVLVDDAKCAYPTGQVIRLLPAESTREAIRAALWRLANQTTPDSTVVIFYSGHGELGSDGMFYIAPQDGDLLKPAQTCISGTELAERIKKIAARKLLLILDCCHAGAAVLAGESLNIVSASLPDAAAAAAPPPDAGAPAQAPAAPAVDGLSEGFGRVVLAAARISESSNADFPLSVFTEAVVKALSGEGKTSTGGFVRLSDLIRFVCAEVPRATVGTQNPIFISTGATDFPVARFSGPPNKFDPDQVDAVLARRELLPPAEPDEPAKPAPAPAVVSPGG